MAMCLYCLKTSTVVSCILLLVTYIQGMGGVLMWGGYKVHDITLLSTLREYRSEDFGWVVLSFGAGVAVIGLLGLFAAFDKSRCVFCLVTAKQYLTPELLLACAVLGAGCFLLYLKSPIQDALSSTAKCQSESILQDSEAAVQRANDYICTVLCPCKSTPALQALITGSGSTRLLMTGSATSILTCQPCEGLQQSLTPQQLPVVQAYLATDNLTLASCQSMSSDDFLDRYFTSDQRRTFPLLEWSEDRYDCAGICTAAPLYLFSDINRGTPTRACRKLLSDWLGDQLPLYGGLTTAIGGFLFLVAVLTVSLCCMRKPLKAQPPPEVSDTNLMCV